jgi:hypothetical protein
MFNRNTIQQQTFLLFIILTIISLGAGYIMMYLFPFNLHDGDLIGSIAAYFAENFDFGGSIRRAPVYPFLLGILYIVFGIYNTFALIFLHSVFIALLGSLIFRISYQLYKSERKAWIIGFLAAANPMTLWYVPRYYVEIVFVYFFILSVWYGYKSYKEKHVKNYILFGFYAAIASLTKAVMLMFPIYLGIGFILIKLIFRKNSISLSLKYVTIFKIIAVSTLVLLLTIMPWTIRNKMVSGRFIIVSSNTGVEFFRGNSYAMDDSFKIGGGLGGELFSNAMKREREIIHESGITDFNHIDHINHKLDSIFNPLMKEYIFHSPGKFFVKILKQIPAFWYLGKDFKYSLIRLIMAALIIIPFVVVVINRPDGFNYSIILTIIYLNIIYAAIIAVGRYSMPLYPLMLIPVINYMIDLLPESISNKILISQ